MARACGLLLRLPRYLLSSIASVFTIAQIVAAVFLYGGSADAVEWIGWLFLWTSAVFGLVPIWTFRRHGEVTRGDSYVHTKVLVDKGIYAVVRHPQAGTSWLLINLGIALVSWHWAIAVLAGLSMALVYADTVKLDAYCVDRFGADYEIYMQRVPRVNPIIGLIRLLAR